MTIKGSRNRLTHLEYTGVADYLRNTDLSSYSFSEVVALASKEAGKPLTGTTVREILTEYKLVYKRLKAPEVTVIAEPRTAWQESVDKKLDMLLDWATSPERK